VERLPEHEPYYPKGQQTDRWERFFVAECAREAVFELYRDELPYACAVEVEEFRERREGPDEVALLLHVEREGQKGILIGQGGRALGRLRERAEASAAKLLGRKLRLSLRVKVWKDWRRDPEALKRLGYLP
jgi:GTP-binding protein Era